MRIPKIGSKIVVLNNSAVATGMTRNGVMNAVRTIPRPKKCRLMRIAMMIARNIEMIAASPVISTVCQAACRNSGSLKSSLYSLNPAHLFVPGSSVFQLRRL